jgi:hypothetical protein
MPAINTPSWSSREDAVVCCDALKQTLDILKERVSDAGSLVSVAAGHVIQRHVINNIHLHPMVGTAVGLALLYPNEERENVIGMSNLTMLAPKDSMLTHQINV